MHVKFSGLIGGDPTRMWESQIALSTPSASIRHSMEGKLVILFKIGSINDPVLAGFLLGYSKEPQLNLFYKSAGENSK